MFEDVIGKSIEFEIVLWMASFDMRKAFDRIEFAPLFNVVRE